MVPKELPGNRRIIEHSYGVVGDKINVYSLGNKYVTDIDEQNRVQQFRFYFIVLVALFIACCYFGITTIFENGLINML